MGDKSFSKNKKGQVTIFIILAMMIVVFGALIYFFLPQIKSTVGLETKDPYSYIQSCLEEKIEDTILNLSLQGGSIVPQSSYLYKGYNLEYLCYTNQYYKTCSVQQPFIKKHIEEEIENAIRGDAKDCFDSLVKNYEGSGYQTSLNSGELNVEILPKRILTSFNNNLRLVKDSTEIYDEFNIVLNYNLYEILGVVTSIIEWESTYGEADALTYMMLYPDLKVEKLKQSDETKVYILTDKNTERKFQFASRSLAFAPGY